MLSEGGIAAREWLIGAIGVIVGVAGVLLVAA